MDIYIFLGGPPPPIDMRVSIENRGAVSALCYAARCRLASVGAARLVESGPVAAPTESAGRQAPAVGELKQNVRVAVACRPALLHSATALPALPACLCRQCRCHTHRVTLRIKRPLMQKPSLPEGVRDFAPDVLRRRKYIFQTIERVFIRFGYQPLETPALEKLSTLTGKYGDEGDKLLFRILNNGDFLSKADTYALENRLSAQLAPSIAERGLRYDLTVPFARFVVMNQGKLPLPFKRYQIQTVWRADRPQKGRYREFTQCDADVVGSTALSYEAELIQIYDQVFSALRIPVTIHINHRKILEAFAEAAHCSNKLTDMTVAIDKLDKIGLDGVLSELAQRGFDATAIDILRDLLATQDAELLNIKLQHTKAGALGFADLSTVYSYLDGYKCVNTLQFDPTLARGLSYYTGCIFEVKAKDVAMGSIGGGGRYDNLTGAFGLPGLSGVGISFGADRIYDVLAATDGFPADLANDLTVLFAAFDADCHKYAFQVATRLRLAGISADVYPEPVKIQKQMKYADDRGVPFVAICGLNEVAQQCVMLKNMVTGAQEPVHIDHLANVLAQKVPQGAARDISK